MRTFLEPGCLERAALWPFAPGCCCPLAAHRRTLRRLSVPPSCRPCTPAHSPVSAPTQLLAGPDFAAPPPTNEAGWQGAAPPCSGPACAGAPARRAQVRQRARPADRPGAGAGGVGRPRRRRERRGRRVGRAREAAGAAPPRAAARRLRGGGAGRCGWCRRRPPAVPRRRALAEGRGRPDRRAARGPVRRPARAAGGAAAAACGVQESAGPPVLQAWGARRRARGAPPPAGRRRGRRAPHRGSGGVHRGALLGRPQGPRRRGLPARRAAQPDRRRLGAVPRPAADGAAAAGQLGEECPQPQLHLVRRLHEDVQEGRRLVSVRA
ncbi:unnamed protein product, partial [Prorocentrum cordatum]